MKNESLTPDPSPKGEGSSMKNSLFTPLLTKAKTKKDHKEIGNPCGLNIYKVRQA